MLSRIGAGAIFSQTAYRVYRVYRARCWSGAKVSKQQICEVGNRHARDPLANQGQFRENSGHDGANATGH